MTTPTLSRPQTPSHAQGTHEDKFLSFRLGKEEYGVEILRVREIIGLIDITPVPQAPAHLRGVVNLRGRIIPVVDLRTLFGMPQAAYTPATCIIFVEVSAGGSAERFQVGVIVDTVSEVLGIPPGQIEAPPPFGCTVRTDFISGIGKVREKVILLLDLDHALTSTELATASGAAPAGAIAAPEGSPAQPPQSLPTSPARAAA